MRKHMLTSENETMNGIRVRGTEVSRVEGLTDAVFGLAVTLLIVSEEVPKTINELFALVMGFPAFAATFFLMLVIWNWHYKYFRKFGLNNKKVIKANGILLFLVLLFMFPLKFFASFVIDYIILEGWFGFEMPVNYSISYDQYNILHVLYACGFASVFWCFSWLYKIAFDERELLQLDDKEALQTQVHIKSFLIVGIVPLFTIPMLFLPTAYAPFIAGFANILVWPIQWLYVRQTAIKLRAMSESTKGNA
ncbi:TMEM175 family protein [Kordiimonas aquimaris]|uniref:TMEM175 family protein n=1 Tax=Kordiimonas aquimaris TaxID=707591 RepID=UPI0021D2D68A|nr:TMEM175 family protein [Kordiimonas aquimaris]